MDDDIIVTCCRETGLSAQTVDFQEMSNFWDKQEAFHLCMRQRAAALHRQLPHQENHFLLLDDVVHDETVRWRDLRATVEQRNIDQL